MVSLRTALCVVLAAATAAGHSPAAPTGRSYHYRYGDDPPPYSAPGHHWYRYSYGGTVATSPPRTGSATYAKGYGYTGLSEKPYIKIYNYDSRRRQHGRDYGKDYDKGHDYSDYSRGYATDYDYGQRASDFKYVREYYRDRYHHSREHEHYQPGHGRDYSDYAGESARRPHEPRRGGSTVVVLGSKKASVDDHPHRGYPGGSSGGYGGHYYSSRHGGGGYHGDDRDATHPGRSHYGGRKGYHSQSYYGDRKSYYGGGGFKSILHGGNGFPKDGGTSYYGGGGLEDDVPGRNYHRGPGGGGGSYHYGTSYHSGSGNHGQDGGRHGGGYHSDYHGDYHGDHHGSHYKDDGGFVSLRALSRLQHRGYRGDGDRYYSASHRGDVHYD